MLPKATDTQTTLRDRYLDLVAKTILNEIQLENEMRIRYLYRQRMDKSPHTLARELIDIRRTLGKEETLRFESMRDQGRHIDDDVNLAVFTYSMIGKKRLENLRYCAEEIFKRGIPGDFIECGVWRGGAAIFLRALIEAFGENRVTWVADSFEGLPAAYHEADEGYDLSKEQYPSLAISQEEVKLNFTRFDLLDHRVRFLKGWFKDTLPEAPIQQIALLRLDGDLYSSTIETLESLYDRVSPGGFIIVDDYGALPPCKKAVDDFRSSRGIRIPIQTIDWTGVYWQKERED